MAVTEDGWDDGDPLVDIRALLNDIVKNNRTNVAAAAGVDEPSAPLLNYGATVVLGLGVTPGFFKLPAAVPKRRVTLIASPVDTGEVTVIPFVGDAINGTSTPVNWVMAVYPVTLTCTTAGAWVGNLEPA